MYFLFNGFLDSVINILFIICIYVQELNWVAIFLYHAAFEMLSYQSYDNLNTCIREYFFFFLRSEIV